MKKQPFRVLLVEDNPHVREMLSYGLERKVDEVLPEPGRSIQVKTANDGQQAFEILSQHHIDLLIADWYMPILDGKQLIEKTRNELQLNDLKILVISASSMSANEDAIVAGANMFLPKPVRLVDLIDAVAQLLKK